ncbi:MULTISPECIES: RNA polymerase sigma factor [Chitinophagaceae]|uniref:RNA polymerase sigma factor n=1 Tax=Chitinophagaceae TaxID=563835 RepID=UPI0013905904|nr:MULTISPECIES: sigma-70 family RNA polymerase sigma factor [Chitinophagaceae]
MSEPTNDNERYLLQGLKAGDEAAFAAIYRQYWQQLFFVALKRLQSADDAKEIVQEVFLTLWQKREGLEIHSLPLYLSAMTRYAVYRATANKQRAQALAAKVAAPKEIAAIDLDNRQLLEILHRLSNELPEKHRLVFVHHKMLDRPLEEVAGMLGVSVRTAEGYSAKVMDFMRRRRKQLALSALPFFFF